MSMTVLCPNCRKTVQCDPTEAERPRGANDRLGKVLLRGRWYRDETLHCGSCQKSFSLSAARPASRVSTEKDLGAALKEEQDTIVVEGNLVGVVLRIRATGKIAWAIAIAAIATVAVLVMTSSTGVGAPAAAALAPVAGGAAVSVLGAGATVSAVLVALAAGGVASLNKLRNYEEVDRSPGRVVLRRR